MALCRVRGIHEIHASYVLGKMLSIATAGLPAYQLVGLYNSVPVRATLRMDALRFEVCQNKYCKKKGSAETLKLMQEAAEGRTDILVEAADMAHTEHGCL